MRIIVIPSGEDFKNRNTAAVIHTMELANHLSKNIQIALFASTSNSNASPKEKLPNLEIKYLPYYSNPLIRWVFKSLVLPFYFSFLFSKIKSNIIYARFGSLTLPSLIAAKLTRKKYIAEVNGLKVDELKVTKKKSILRDLQICLVKMLEKLTYKSSDKIITVTLGIKKELHELYNIPLSKMEVVPNGVNIDLFRPIDNTKEKLGLDPNYKYVGFVGNLTRWQGIEYLIKAAPEIIKRESNVRFLIVGDGILRKDLENTVKDLKLENYFTFFGIVDYKKVSLYINSFDVCVAPWIKARNERIGLSPLKLFDYLACGKAVVAGDVKGVRDILVNNNLGKTVDVTKIEEIANAVLNLLQDEQLRNEIGRRGRKLVINRYSWKLTAEKIENILKEFCL